MFNSQEEDEKSHLPYITKMVAVAVLLTIGNELVRWGIHELKEKFGSKKKESK